jgi:chemotaxis protein histidine kinase CheA
LDIDPNRAVPFGLHTCTVIGDGQLNLVADLFHTQHDTSCPAGKNVLVKEKDSAKIPEKRGSDYVAIFVRQLGGAIVPSGSEETGTTVRVRFPLLLVPPGGAERTAA